jgi:hypothetical protein
MNDDDKESQGEPEQETFEHCSDKSIEILLGEENETGGDWSEVSKVEDEYGNKIEVFKFRLPSGLYKLKAFVDVNGITPAVVHNVLYDIEERVKWDSGGKDMQVVEKINDNLDIIYFWAKAPPGFSNREFLQSRYSRIDSDGTHYICYRSVKHDKFPETKSKVRAYTQLSGYVIRPKEGGCRVTFLSNNDIKGTCPGWVINLLAGFFMKKWLFVLRNACYDRAKLLKERDEAAAAAAESEEGGKKKKKKQR